MKKIWDHLKAEHNRTRLSFIGALIAGVSVAVWQVYYEEKTATTNEVAKECGKFDSSVYSNNCLGFELTLPGTWNVADNELSSEAGRYGGQLIAGDNKQLQDAVDVAASMNPILLLASKYPMSSLRVDNTSLAIGALDISGMAEFDVEGDYFEAIKKALETTKASISFPEPVYEKWLGGILFDVITLQFDMGLYKSAQKQYATIYEEHLLLITVTYHDEASLAELERILKTLAFYHSRVDAPYNKQPKL